MSQNIAIYQKCSKCSGMGRISQMESQRRYNYATEKFETVQKKVEQQCYVCQGSGRTADISYQPVYKKQWNQSNNNPQTYNQQITQPLLMNDQIPPPIPINYKTQSQMKYQFQQMYLTIKKKQKKQQQQQRYKQQQQKKRQQQISKKRWQKQIQEQQRKRQQYEESPEGRQERKRRDDSFRRFKCKENIKQCLCCECCPNWACLLLYLGFGVAFILIIFFVLYPNISK